MIDDALIAHQLDADENWDRLERFAAAWRYYDGEHDAPITTKRDALVVNNAGTIVDIGVDYLFGTSANGQVIEFRVGENDEGNENPLQDALDRIWRANRKNTLLRDLSLNGGVTGHPWLRLRPPAAPGLAPTVVVVDPAMVSVAWDPADYTRLLAIRVEWTTLTNDGVEAWREDHELDESGAAWTITTSRTVSDATNTAHGRVKHAIRWDVVGEPEQWSHPWPQLVSCQNLPKPNEFWGRSDIELDVRALNDGLNAIASDARKTLRHFAHPKPVGYGFTADSLEFDTAIGDMIVVPDKDARIENLEMQSDLSSAYRMLEWLDAKQWERSAIPKIAAGRIDDAGQMSSLALEILFRPLVAKTNTKRDLYGDLLTTVCGRLLVLGGHLTDADAAEVEIVWPDVLPKNAAEAAQTAATIVRDVGGSSTTQLERLGMDAEDELAKRQAESTAGLGNAVAAGGLFADLLGGGGPAPVEDAPEAA